MLTFYLLNYIYFLHYMQMTWSWWQRVRKVYVIR